MRALPKFLNVSRAADRLGVSVKALRLYERHGLVQPGRTAAGWRAYGPAEMARAAEVVALRALGLSLAQVGRVLGGDAQDLDTGLAVQEARLLEQSHRIAETLQRIRSLRADLAGGQALSPGVLGRLLVDGLSVAFDLPWPWGGERFELRGIRPLTYITGPLGSGKTVLARLLAQSLPDAAFIEMDRPLQPGTVPGERVELALAWLAGEGAGRPEALVALMLALEADGPEILVVDMVEEGLDEAAQAALAAWLRRGLFRPHALFLLTRSSVILDLDAVGGDETIILCPANHSPPLCVPRHKGARGYEALASCLAPPDVRARTAGVVASRAALRPGRK